MNWTDFAIILILVASVLYSLFRGLVREVFSLLSLILGFIAASRMYPYLAGFLLTWISSKQVANILGFVLIFIAASLLMSLLGRLVRRFIRNIHLESIDRMMGAFFGLIKGAFIVTVVILMLVAFLPLAHPVLKNSKLSPYFVALGEITLRVMPDKFGQMVREKKKKLFQYRKSTPENQIPFGVKTCSFTS